MAGLVRHGVALATSPLQLSDRDAFRTVSRRSGSCRASPGSSPPGLSGQYPKRRAQKPRPVRATRREGAETALR